MNCQDLSPEIYQQQQIQQYQLSQPQQILQQQYQQYSQQSQQYQQVQLQHQNMFTPSPNVITQPIQQPIQPIQPLPVGTNLNNPYVGKKFFIYIYIYTLKITDNISQYKEFSYILIR